MADLDFSLRQPHSPDLNFGEDAPPAVYIDITLAATLTSSDMMSSTTQIDNAVSRGPAAWSSGKWRNSQTSARVVASLYQAPKKIVAEIGSGLDDAAPMTVEHAARWGEMQRLVNQPGGAWRAALPISSVSGDSWENLNPRLRPELLTIFANSAQVRSYASGAWITLHRHRRPMSTLQVETGIQKTLRTVLGYAPAIHLRLAVEFPWAEGRLAEHGISPHPGGTVPPPAPSGYKPPAGNSVALIFRDRQPASVNLAFKAAESVATIVVPIRSIYMQANDATLVLATNGQSIPVLGGFSLSLDVDSWVWGFSARVPGSYLSILSAELGNLVEVIATVNGTAFTLAIERVSRERQFGKATLAISGRGRAAWLGAPYADVISRANVGAATAQQLMASALTENGISMGWALDWQITDWLIPAGAWSHTGTAMEACLAIAEAGGAYIQAHRTEQTLSVLPRYSSAPWNWSGLTPDIELPEDVCVTEGIEWVDKPVYNTVFISGQRDGRLSHVTRQGSGGDRAAPMVTDALNTHSDAGLQRGTRILSDTGRQKMITLSLPILAETGIIVPGKLVRYRESGIQHLGLTRGVDVSVEFPKQRQSIKIESHVL